VFVFYEGTTAAGILLNDEKFWMLYGNHKTPNKKENRSKSFPRDYLWTLAKGCYTDTRRGKEFYTEAIYTLLEENK